MNYNYFLVILSPTMHGFIQPIIATMTVLASLICSFLIIWGGFMYLTSSGNVKKLQAAKRVITRSLIGLVIVFSASTVSLMLSHAYGSDSTGSQQHLPVLNAVKPATASGGLVDVLISAISGLLEVIIESAARPFISALSYFTNGTPLMANNISVMHLWVISTSIADSLMVIVLALIGFHVMGGEMFGMRDINLSALLPQILLIFALINSSIFILDGLIELSNAMINALRAGVGNVNPWHSLLQIISNVTGYSLPALAILIIFLIFTVILLIYYIGRIVTLYLGAVLAPLIVLLWLVPGFRDFAENALKTYLSTIFVLFIHVIILSLAGSLFADISSSNRGTPDPIMSLLLGLATLVALIKTQGVLMQLNHSSLGPKAARQLGGSFINGISYLAVSAKYNFAGAFNAVAEGKGTINRLMPDSNPVLINNSNKPSAPSNPQ